LWWALWNRFDYNHVQQTDCGWSSGGAPEAGLGHNWAQGNSGTLPVATVFFCKDKKLNIILHNLFCMLITQCEYTKQGCNSLTIFCFQVNRLDAAMEAEKSGNVKKDDEKVDKRKRSSDASPDEESKDAKRIKVEDVSTLNAKELKDALSTRGLSTSGKKAELVERLTEAVKEQDQSADVIKVEDISNMNVKELKEALSTRGLPTNGKKSELVERLTEALDGKATDKTAATSVEDDEGVNLFFTLQHLFISIICRNEFRY
jgi:phenylpyruvate tautomerase PptA (4-oxalocrotonate tautomerase family)